MHIDYVNSRYSFETEARVLNAIGATKTKGSEHPHILDLANDMHKSHIHNM